MQEEGIPKIIERNNLAKMLGCCPSTFTIYLDRAEFSHVERYRIYRRKLYKGLTVADIKHLSELVEKGKKRRFGRKYKKRGKINESLQRKN